MAGELGRRQHPLLQASGAWGVEKEGSLHDNRARATLHVELSSGTG
jgi:hypothetical protein